MVAHLSTVKVIAKRKQNESFFGFGGKQTGKFLSIFFATVMGWIPFSVPYWAACSSRLHLLVWGLPVHWQNRYLEMPSFQAGA